MVQTQHPQSIQVTVPVSGMLPDAREISVNLGDVPAGPLNLTVLLVPSGPEGSELPQRLAADLHVRRRTESNYPFDEYEYGGGD